MTGTNVLKEREFGKRFNKALWLKLYGFTKPHRKSVFFLCLFGFTTALCDLSFPLVTKSLVDEAAVPGSEVSYLSYGILYLGLVLALTQSVRLFIHYAGTVRTHVAHDIRRAGFENLQRLSFAYFDKHPVGWLMSRMTSDCERLSNILTWGTLDLVWGTTLIFGIAVTLFILHPLLALVVLAVLPLLAWVSAKFQTMILGSARRVRKANSLITARFNEGISGVRTTKVFSGEEQGLMDFQKLSGEMYSASVRNQIQSSLFFPIVMTIGSLATGLALSFGGVQYLAGSLSVGTLLAFLAYTRRFFDPIEDLSHWFAELQMAQASAERILGLIETVPEIRDRPSLSLASAERAVPIPRSIGDIRFERVSFSYGEGPKVLSGFDIRVQRGESIALVGPTGGGKSTIVSLLCRFYEPTEGRILMSGVDYRDLGLSWLQSRLGIVLQEPRLFSGTIAENIRYGKLEASKEELLTAAELVGAGGFIRDLPQGLETEVGEGGCRLSTGQKQLISFARAVIGEPEILVMDEATSSIDTETEARIQRGVDRVLKGRTSFVIAHRLSTIRKADRILFIARGRIVEQGSHEDLLRKGGAYFDLYTRQRSRDAWSETLDGGTQDPCQDLGRGKALEEPS
jgi:ATP-binding cassette subfamily B protein